MSGNCELGRGLLRREKYAAEGGAGRFEKPAPDARAAPPEAHESLIGRKTVEEVPLTGLSFGLCHLEADMIAALLAGWDVAQLHYFFIENVGNHVFPTSWDLGESVRLALLSVTEGEDKPLKYPGLFNTADVAAIMKIDLAAACEFNRDAARTNIEAVRPGMRILETSAKNGAGFDEWLDYLADRRAGLAQE